MCISILSTAHPDYPFILVSNRDEFISRPTLRADWWDAPYSHVLGGRDVQRAERGTWLGITKQGRIAVLTNFREPGQEVAKEKSRGGITNCFLQVPQDWHESESEFVQRMIEQVGIHDVGGFSLAFGTLRAPKQDIPSTNGSTASLRTYPGLSILSNRTTSHTSRLPHILSQPNETHGLSNSHFGDVTWPKIVHGEQFVRQAIHGHIVRGSKDPQKLIDRLFEILEIDMMPQRGPLEQREDYSFRMRGSIFIDALKGEVAVPAVGVDVAGDIANGVRDMQLNGTTSAAATESNPQKGLGPTAYGTQKQTVILVDRNGHVIFVERTLFDEHGRPLPPAEQARRIEFNIEGWFDEHEEPEGECLPDVLAPTSSLGPPVVEPDQQIVAGVADGVAGDMLPAGNVGCEPGKSGTRARL